MTGRDEAGNSAPSFGDYPPDFFDFIIIDECHRGGANNESNWREIMEYFSPAIQLGLTATPKRKNNVDTYSYFGEPVYIYSLKEGINDGYLTPFKVRQIVTTLDDYVYTSDDTIIEGEVEKGKVYDEDEFKQIIGRGTRLFDDREEILTGHEEKQQAFLEFVLGEYIREGVEELDPAKLPGLLELKYGNTYEATEQLGNVSMIRETFVGFQGYLYEHPDEKR